MKGRGPAARTSLRVAGLLALAVLAGCGSPTGGEDAKGGAGVPRPTPDTTTTHHLSRIGSAYLKAVKEKRTVNGPNDLRLGDRDALTSPRDGKPFKIVWGFNPEWDRDPILPGGGLAEMLLAWEETADAQGKRFVLRADGTTVDHLSGPEFAKAPKAVPKKK